MPRDQREGAPPELRTVPARQPVAEPIPYQQGDRVADRYRVAALLGADPLGWVFRIHDDSASGTAVMQVLSQRLFAVPELRREFLGKQRKLCDLRDPAFVRLFDAIEDHGRACLIWEPAAGTALSSPAARTQAWTLYRVGQLLLEIGEACERAKVTHGDLGARNLFILDKNRVRIAHLGLCENLPRSAYVSALRTANAHHALAPELRLGADLDPHADAFAAAVLIGELIHGRPVDRAEDLPADPPGVPSWLRPLLLRALSPARRDRLASVLELAALIQEGLSGKPWAPAAPVRPRERPILEADETLEVVDAWTDPRVKLARAVEAAKLAEEAEQSAGLKIVTPGNNLPWDPAAREADFDDKTEPFFTLEELTAREAARARPQAPPARQEEWPALEQAEPRAPNNGDTELAVTRAQARPAPSFSRLLGDEAEAGRGFAAMLVDWICARWASAAGRR